MDFVNLQQMLDRLVRNYVPGNCVSVRKDGKEIFRYASGFSDVENEIPMTGDELLNIYSCSKVLTVTAALQLYEKGIYLLDDPLYAFMPEFKDMTVKNKDGTLTKAGRAITLRHLFTMTSGLDYNTGRKAFAAAREKTNGKMETREVIRCLAEEPLCFEPGEHWNYSLSHDVLAAFVETVSGMKFRDYVKKNIFDPVGMEHSCYHSENMLDKMAQQYRYVRSDDREVFSADYDDIVRPGRYENVGKNNSLIFGTEYDSGGAGVITTMEDYSKFCHCLAIGGMTENGERIISEGTIDLMRTDQLTEEQRKTFGGTQYIGYGYGLGVRTLIDKAKSGSPGNYGEFGWGGAAGATVLIDPKENLSMFYAMHLLDPWEEYYQPRIRNALYSCDFSVSF